MFASNHHLLEFAHSKRKEKGQTEQAEKQPQPAKDKE